MKLVLAPRGLVRTQAPVARCWTLIIITSSWNSNDHLVFSAFTSLHWRHWSRQSLFFTAKVNRARRCKNSGNHKWDTPYKRASFCSRVHKIGSWDWKTLPEEQADHEFHTFTISSSSTRSCLRHFRDTLCSLASCRVSLRTVVLRQITTSTLQNRRKVFNPRILRSDQPQPQGSTHNSILKCLVAQLRVMGLQFKPLKLVMSNGNLNQQIQ